MARGPVTLRRELLDAFAFLILAAVLVTGVSLIAILPLLRNPSEITVVLLLIVLGDLVVVGLFGTRILDVRLMKPVDRLVDDVRRIADGDYEHRVGPVATTEFEVIRDGVNAMADRLVRHQELLADNVDSLDRTNRELVEARDQVVQAARLASVGTLAAGIAHEVGNPLGAIVAFTDVARARARREGGDSEVLDSIREEAERIDRLVRSLLDFARHKDQEACPTDPQEVVARVRSLLERQGRLTDVAASWPDPDSRMPDVFMEPGRLEQVLVNLLLNALDAVEGRGGPAIAVTLETERGAVHALPAKRQDDPPGVNYMHRRRVSKDQAPGGVDPLFTARRVVVIRVRDNGPGIPEEERERVFDPFFTTKEPGKGTGLGLYISARFVEGMGGRLYAAEARHGGAEFVIRLPGLPPAHGGDQ
jgi:hypothetical protein